MSNENIMRPDHGPVIPFVAASHHDVHQNPALIEQNPPLVRAKSLHDVTEQISSIVEGDVLKTPMKYWIVLSITGSITVLLGAMLTYLVATGIGVWGNNRPI